MVAGTATRGEKQRRQAFLNLANRLGIEARVIYCRAPIDVLRNRIAARESAGADASEATLDVLDHQLATFAAPDATEPVVTLNTDVPLDNEMLSSLFAAE